MNEVVKLSCDQNLLNIIIAGLHELPGRVCIPALNEVGRQVNEYKKSMSEVKDITSSDDKKKGEVVQITKPSA